MEEIKDCAWCGGHAVIEGRHHPAVACTICGIRGETALTKGDAITYWNEMQEAIGLGKEVKARSRIEADD